MDFLTAAGLRAPGQPTCDRRVQGSLEFAVDELDEDGEDPRNPSVPKWYRYNFVRHVILARSNVYLVRTGGGEDALVRFESYYCHDQSPGCVTFSYALVPAATMTDGSTAAPLSAR